MANPKVDELVRMGFELSYSDPLAEPGIPLDEPWMSYYRSGMEAGKAARAEADSVYDGPVLGPERSGENWDAYQKRLDELLEFMFHKHEPHIETEPPEVVFGR